MNSSFTARRVHPWKALEKTGLRAELLYLAEAAVDEHVLPRDQHLIQDENGVVLVQPRGQRVIEWAAHRRGHGRIRWPADQLHPGRVHSDSGDESEFPLAHWQAVVGDEVVVRQGRAGGDDLGAANDQAAVGFALHVHEDVLDLVGRPVPVHRGMHDRVVPEQHLLLRLGVPAPRVLFERLVELGVSAQRAEERRLVVGTAPHPAVGHPRPLRDSLLVRDKILGAVRGGEEAVGVAVAAGVGRRGQDGRPRRVVQGVVQPGDHRGRIAERRMRGHILDPFAVEVDLAPVAQALDVLLAGQRPGRARHGLRPATAAGRCRPAGRARRRWGRRRCRRPAARPPGGPGWR
jgi:hypothetical protein